VCGRLRILIPRGSLILPQSREPAEVRAQPYSSGAHRPCSARAITADKKKKKTIFRLHATAALKIEAVKEQNKILENIKITRLAITIDNEDKEIIINDLPFVDDLPPVDDLSPLSTAPAILDGRSKRARAGTIDYRALTRLSRIREEIERLNQETERKKKAKTAEMALRSPVKKKSRFIDAKAFERK
jgi:hypothetical protein